jgi:GNAT superfamily N-acetyltransferase
VQTDLEAPVQQWGAERIEELTALVALAAPDEDLTADELLTACYDHPGVVLGSDDGAGAVAVGVGRDPEGVLVASLRLVVVHPERRGRGLGGGLLAAAEGWATDRGAQRIELGGALPFSLWPGVDPGSGLVGLARSRGYLDTGERRSFRVPASFRAPEPTGIAVRRAVRDDDVTAVTLAVSSRWPRRSDETARALDHGTCHAAFTSSPADPSGASGEVVGIGCHSVTRATWVGPLLVRPAERRRGIGRALLGQICRDLTIADFPWAEVPGVTDPGAVQFLSAAGAEVVRTHRGLAKLLG